MQFMMKSSQSEAVRLHCTKSGCHLHLKQDPGCVCVTWVCNRGDSDFVVGFTRAEASNYILNPPQLLSHLDLLLLPTETETQTAKLVGDRGDQYEMKFFASGVCNLQPIRNSQTRP